MCVCECVCGQFKMFVAPIKLDKKKYPSSSTKNNFVKF